MAVGRIGPGAGADAMMLYAAENYPKRCGHGKPWDEECADCNAVWREEQVKTLHKQALKYGFVLAPDASAGGRRHAMSYDSRCYDLAEIFMADEAHKSERATAALAQKIQDTIEDFLNYEDLLIYERTPTSDG